MESRKQTMTRQIAAASIAVTLVMSLACGGRGCGSSPATSSTGAGTGPDLNGGIALSQAASVSSWSADQKRQAYDAEVTALRARTARVQALVSALPVETVDLRALADSLASPDDAFAFVRDRIALEPYAGVMKGASGTLVSRGGNALDRALLLAAVLAVKGVSAEIAHGRLSAANASTLLRQIGTQPSAVLQIAHAMPKPPPAAVLSADSQRWVDTIQKQAAARGAELLEAANSGLAHVEAALGGSRQPASAPETTQLGRLQDHFWVRASAGGQTLDFDSAFAFAKPGQSFAEAVETFQPEHVPDQHRHRLTVRVVADYVADSIVTTQELVRAEAGSADLADAPIRIVLEPAAIARDQNAFIASVTLGKAAPIRKRFTLRSEAPRAGAIADVFGALSEPEPVNGEPRLGRLAVELISAAPSAGDARYRRVVLDRLDADGQSAKLLPDLENDDSVRNLLVQVWEGALSFGAASPVQLFRRELETITAEQAMTEQALATRYLGKAFDRAHVAPPQFPRQLAEFYFHSSMSHDLLVDSDGQGIRMFYERPQLGFVRHGVVVHDWSNPGGLRRFQDSLDLINLPYAFVGPADAARNLRLQVGVADTSLERALAREGLDFNTLPLMAAAGAQNVAIMTVEPSEPAKIRQLTIPAALKSVMLHELASGRTLVVPTNLVAMNDVKAYGWWSVDPETGVPLGHMDLGAGQGAVESAKLTEATATLSHTLGKLYGGFVACLFMEAANQLGPQEGLQPGFTIPGTAAVQRGQDLGECLAAKWCEAVIEYAFLAAGVASFHHRIWWQEMMWIGLHLFGPAAVSYLSCHH
jgi:hypothetical protein